MGMARGEVWNNFIEMQKHFIQESNCHSMWDTTGETNTTTKKLPKMTVVPYAAAERLSKGGQSQNKLRVWLEEMARNDTNCQKYDWDLLFEFSLNLFDFYTY